MKKSLILFLLYCLSLVSAFASHIRGGEITTIRRAGSSNTYDFTLSIYHDPSVDVQGPTARMDFGDGTSGTAPLASDEPIPLAAVPTNVRKYFFSHTYGAPGQYIASSSEQFRNNAVLNIGPSPGTVWFYVESMITIAPSIDQPPNSSPVLLSFAVDQGSLGQVYLNNPSAYDVDGDSLSFELIESRNYIPGLGGSRIQGYNYPDDYALGTDSAGSSPANMSIDPVKGLLRWDVPNRIGEYNVAFIVREWRFGRIIGYVVRDLQIIIRDGLNRRPIVQIPQDTCLLAGSLLQKIILGKDPNINDLVAITATGGLFNLSPPSANATINPPNTTSQSGEPVFQVNPARTSFRWQPGCAQVRKAPYDAVFKAQDRVISPNSGNELVDIKTWSITVIGPPPTGLRTTPGLGSIRLNWDTYTCRNIAYFNIYRKVDTAIYSIDTCTIGVPSSSGFQLVGFTDGVSYTFLDDNNGLGLKRSLRYCYRVTAVFNGATPVESKQSNQACAELKLDIPLITNVSVVTTDRVIGSMFIRWLQPKEIDKIRFPGPYRYVLKRARSGSSVYETLKSTQDLADTTYLDENLDTDQRQYTYRLVFVFNDPLGGVFRDSGDVADNILFRGSSSSRSITLNWSAQVPWDNSRYPHSIYKQIGPNIRKIADIPAGVNTYIDLGTPEPLVAGSFYKYVVVTRGRYSRLGTPDTLVNQSYELVVQLKDSVPPCPPQEFEITNVNTTCPTCEDILKNPVLNNQLRWKAPKRDSCALDLKEYAIYYKPTRNAPFQKIAVTLDTFFLHNNKGSLAGCYKVVAVDSSGNESLLTDSAVCNDNCIAITLPNLITPNNDALLLNEVWKPICITSGFVAEAELNIYNSWGGLVYTSKSKNIQWPERSEKVSDVLPGVYYYYIKLKTIQLEDTNPFQTYKGWIEVAAKN